MIEDERDIRELVRVNLEAEGFSVLEAADGELGLALVKRERPAAVILDLMLPGLGGLEVCRRIRAGEATARMPVVVLTARSAEADKVVGLEIGADDYVTKPFSPRELTARVKALLRRAYSQQPDVPQEVYERGGLRIDFDTYEVYLDGQRVELSLREFELLRFFVQHPNRVYERSQLLELVWGPDTYVEPRTIDVHIRRLRRRIERDDSTPELIVTVRGVGLHVRRAAARSLTGVADRDGARGAFRLDPRLARARPRARRRRPGRSGRCCRSSPVGFVRALAAAAAAVLVGRNRQRHARRGGCSSCATGRAGSAAASASRRRCAPGERDAIDALTRISPRWPSELGSGIDAPRERARSARGDPRGDGRGRHRDRRPRHDPARQRSRRRDLRARARAAR